MQVYRPVEQGATLVGWGVRVLLLEGADSGAVSATTRRIAGLGGCVEVETEMFTALEALMDGATVYGLFVMDCDDFGGLEAGHKAFALLGLLTAQIPVILVSRDCEQQIFPENRQSPIILRAPLSAVSLRVGFEFALRNRMLSAA